MCPLARQTQSTSHQASHLQGRNKTDDDVCYTVEPLSSGHPWVMRGSLLVRCSAQTGCLLRCPYFRVSPIRGPL